MQCSHHRKLWITEFIKMCWRILSVIKLPTCNTAGVKKVWVLNKNADDLFPGFISCFIANLVSIYCHNISTLLFKAVWNLFAFFQVLRSEICTCLILIHLGSITMLTGIHVTFIRPVWLVWCCSVYSICLSLYNFKYIQMQLILWCAIHMASHINGESFVACICISA